MIGRLGNGTLELKRKTQIDAGKRTKTVKKSAPEMTVIASFWRATFT